MEFSRAVERAVELTDPEETLIIVTADHSHVFTVAGYVDYDAPILGKHSHMCVAFINTSPRFISLTEMLELYIHALLLLALGSQFMQISHQMLITKT